MKVSFIFCLLLSLALTKGPKCEDNDDFILKGFTCEDFDHDGCDVVIEVDLDCCSEDEMKTVRHNCPLTCGECTFTCSNTDNGVLDLDDHACDTYRKIHCGIYDGLDFISPQMCCICGGGLESTLGVPDKCTHPRTATSLISQYDVTWSELTADQQSGMQKIGIKKSTWDDFSKSSYFKNWDEFSSEQQKMMVEKLCFDKETWKQVTDILKENQLNCPNVQSINDLKELYNFEQFTDLTTPVKKLLKLIGLTEKTLKDPSLVKNNWTKFTETDLQNAYKLCITEEEGYNSIIGGTPAIMLTSVGEKRVPQIGRIDLHKVDTVIILVAVTLLGSVFALVKCFRPILMQFGVLKAKPNKTLRLDNFLIEKCDISTKNDAQMFVRDEI